MNKSQTVKAYIIAGGKSSRFKQDKTIFEFRGKPLIQHVFDTIGPLFDSVSIISNETDKFDFLGTDTYPDIVPDLGPLGGIYSALIYAGGARTFIFASDMPFLNRDFITYMSSLPESYDIIVPFLNGHFEPLHAIYSESCTGPLKDLIDSGEKQILKAYNRVKLRNVSSAEIEPYDDPEKIFTNINYLRDIEEHHHAKKL